MLFFLRICKGELYDAQYKTILAIWNINVLLATACKLFCTSILVLHISQASTSNSSQLKQVRLINQIVDGNKCTHKRPYDLY